MALSLAVALPAGLVAWEAQAVNAAANAPAQSAETVSVQPPPGIDADPIASPINMPSDPQQAAMIQRGQYLAVAGDCQYCHSIPGGKPYAGGQPVQTPFGDLVTPNITPDATYGIGNWSDAQFWNALHNGIGPGHSLLVFPHYLYPLMPWQDYNKLSYPDVMAIKAYLDSIQPVAQPDRPTQMHFPFTIRAGLLGWRLLFFRDHPIHYDPSWSPQVRNGYFLVEALAHCSECHTQRNLLMATEPSRYLAGGKILAQSWYAPDITMNKATGIGGWSSTDLFNYLHDDGGMGTGGPYGPMKSVVDDSLSRLPASDVQDIVAYLQTGTPDLPAEIPAAAAAQPEADGAALYVDHCARCHGGNGEGVNNNFPNLAGNESVWDGPPENIVSMILGGFQPWHSDQSSMPEFNQSLSDGQIAAIANYVRTSWGNKGVADATADMVGSERRMTSDWVALSTGTTQAVLGDEHFDDISGKLELFGDRDNCMFEGRFNNSDPNAAAKSVNLVGACTRGGGTFLGMMSVNGKTMPVTLEMQEEVTGTHLTVMRLFGTAPGTGQNFDARIDFASAVE